MATRNRKEEKSQEAVEPEVLEPSVEELAVELPAGAPLSDASADGQAKAESTAVVPATGLQQYLAEVRRYPYLTKEEELMLFHEYRTQGSREAAVKLILANLRVSVAIASEYLHTGADHLDLIQEGNVGLMQAIKKFDPTKNVRFYAYAAWWSRAYILRYLLNNFRLVKIGTTQDQRKLFYNLKKEKSKLEREGFAPDTKLLADRLNVRERDVIEMDQRLGNWELSLDQPIGEEQDSTLLDILPSQQVAADDQIADNELRVLFRKKLAEFTKTLDEREEDILRNRLLSETPLTLDDLGAKYGVTKERTRQLEARIIKRLREYMKKDVKDFDRL
ncbi:sigma-70 family RNA polymerase sigma factor [Nitrospira moscoviensis]|uniref:RNA polymerase sigma factor n=1 Tax=Nitrospira moscoviensis TaxID=42253 RepID=A0A0K2G9U6_NITMO|nr:RNA polymerase factor sigma-32 [Nitrospira moscoviensis]ALA57723.1 RNA polymerase sigma factor [Nitrospira moscoviensis]